MKLQYHIEKSFHTFLLKFSWFNYQLTWLQQDQKAYINFLQVLTETELLPFIIRDRNKHIHYKMLPHLSPIILD